MKNRPTCQICCVYHALFHPFVRYAVNSMQKSTFSRFWGSDPPGCLLGASGCLWVPLGASGCLLGCFLSVLGVSWVSPGSLLGFSSSQVFPLYDSSSMIPPPWFLLPDSSSLIPSPWFLLHDSSSMRPPGWPLLKSNQINQNQFKTKHIQWHETTWKSIRHSTTQMESRQFKTNPIDTDQIKLNQIKSSQIKSFLLSPLSYPLSTVSSLMSQHLVSQ